MGMGTHRGAQSPSLSCRAISPENFREFSSDFSNVLESLGKTRRRVHFVKNRRSRLGVEKWWGKKRTKKGGRDERFFSGGTKKGMYDQWTH